MKDKNTQEELERLELMQKRLELLQSISLMQPGFVSLGWAMNNILGVDEEKLSDYFKNNKL
jgi:hypothetical protein